MEKLTIGEVAQRAGLRPSAIRYYESIQLLPAPQRTSGRRCYTVDVLERLNFIQAAQQLGFSLVEIRQLFNTTTACPSLSESWQRLAQQKLREINTLIRQAEDVKQHLIQGLNCECSNLDNCIECVTRIYFQ